MFSTGETFCALRGVRGGNPLSTLSEMVCAAAAIGALASDAVSAVRSSQNKTTAPFAAFSVRGRGVGGRGVACSTFTHRGSTAIVEWYSATMRGSYSCTTVVVPVLPQEARRLNFASGRIIFLLGLSQEQSSSGCGLSGPLLF